MDEVADDSGWSCLLWCVYLRREKEEGKVECSISHGPQDASRVSGLKEMTFGDTLGRGVDHPVAMMVGWVMAVRCLFAARGVTSALERLPNRYG